LPKFPWRDCVDNSFFHHLGPITQNSTKPTSPPGKQHQNNNYKYKHINILLGKIPLKHFLMTERKHLGWDASNFRYE
jgi:hypothetical protein